MIRPTITAFAVAGVLCACAGRSPIPEVATAQFDAATAHAYVAANDIPPRFQWEANYGYCGETSEISAGLYYGQYASQYDARAIASPGVPQNEATSQLLLGANDRAAATAMHLQSLEWHAGGPSAKPFLAWVAHNVALGRPVIIGVMNNEYRLYGNTGPQKGSVFYDHIVPVLSVMSAHQTGRGYDPNAVIEISDNGLFGTHGNYPYLFRYRFADFQRTRAEANAPHGPMYSLAYRKRNYGIAITGVADANHETLPVRVATSVNYERPSIVNHSTKRPKPMPLVLTVTVSGLTPGASYRLYRYDDFASVPDGAFNANAGMAAQRSNVRITKGSTYAFSTRIMSNEEVIYRAVPANAP